jgi:hypothetical protein
MRCDAMRCDAIRGGDEDGRDTTREGRICCCRHCQMGDRNATTVGGSSAGRPGGSTSRRRVLIDDGLDGWTMERLKRHRAMQAHSLVTSGWVGRPLSPCTTRAWLARFHARYVLPALLPRYISRWVVGRYTGKTACLPSPASPGPKYGIAVSTALLLVGYARPSRVV